MTPQTPDPAAANDCSFTEWACAAVEWHRGAFPDETPEQLGLCLAEEAGELVRTILKESHGSNDRRADVNWPKERRKELADLMLAVICIAERDGMDVPEFVEALWSGLRAVSDRFPGSAPVGPPQEPAPTLAERYPQPAAPTINPDTFRDRVADAMAVILDAFFATDDSAIGWECVDVTPMRNRAGGAS